MPEPIKPCPFPACGSSDVRVAFLEEDNIAVACNICNSHGPAVESEATAIALWNAAPRPEPARTCATCLYFEMVSDCSYGDCRKYDNTSTGDAAAIQLCEPGFGCIHHKPRPVAGQEA